MLCNKKYDDTLQCVLLKETTALCNQPGYDTETSEKGEVPDVVRVYPSSHLPRQISHHNPLDVSFEPLGMFLETLLGTYQGTSLPTCARSGTVIPPPICA